MCWRKRRKKQRSWWSSDPNGVALSGLIYPGRRNAPQEVTGYAQTLLKALLSESIGMKRQLAGVLSQCVISAFNPVNKESNSNFTSTRPRFCHQPEFLSHQYMALRVLFLLQRGPSWSVRCRTFAVFSQRVKSVQTGGNSSAKSVRREGALTKGLAGAPESRAVNGPAL